MIYHATKNFSRSLNKDEKRFIIACSDFSVQARGFKKFQQSREFGNSDVGIFAISVIFKSQRKHALTKLLEIIHHDILVIVRNVGTGGIVDKAGVCST
jgi:hypothetical protein